MDTTIHYTTDGSILRNPAPVYTGPITVEKKPPRCARALSRRRAFGQQDGLQNVFDRYSSYAARGFADYRSSEPV